MEKSLTDTVGPVVEPPSAPRRGIAERLGGRSLVLVGLMGAGKSTVGRRLAARLGLAFRDADHEIESAAGMPISDIFSIYGEGAFRDGERRVIARLLDEGGMVLATGGGAYMNPDTRAKITTAAIAVWLKADLDTLMRRVRRRTHRPLLQVGDPEATMQRLMGERHPVYSLADVTVLSGEGSHDRVAQEVVEAVSAFLDAGGVRP